MTDTKKMATSNYICKIIMVQKFRFTIFSYALLCFSFLWVENLVTYLKNEAWSDGGHGMIEEVTEQIVEEHTVVEKHRWAV